MDDERLKRLCRELPPQIDVLPTPPLAFSPEEAHRIVLNSSGSPPSGGEFRLGQSGISCRLQEEGGRGLVLYAHSNDRSLAGRCVWVALHGKDDPRPDRMAVRKLVLCEAEQGGCQGSLWVGLPSEIARKLGPDAQLAVFPPRETAEAQQTKALAAVILVVRKRLCQELRKQTEPANWYRINQVFSDLLIHRVSGGAADLGREPFESLLADASRLLRKAVKRLPDSTKQDVAAARRNEKAKRDHASRRRKGPVSVCPR